MDNIKTMGQSWLDKANNTAWINKHTQILGKHGPVLVFNSRSDRHASHPLVRRVRKYLDDNNVPYMEIKTDVSLSDPAWIKKSIVWYNKRIMGLCRMLENPRTSWGTNERRKANIVKLYKKKTELEKLKS